MYCLVFSGFLLTTYTRRNRGESYSERKGIWVYRDYWRRGHGTNAHSSTVSLQGPIIYVSHLGTVSLKHMYKTLPYTTCGSH